MGVVLNIYIVGWRSDNQVYAIRLNSLSRQNVIIDDNDIIARIKYSGWVQLRCSFGLLYSPLFICPMMSEPCISVCSPTDGLRKPRFR